MKRLILFALLLICTISAYAQIPHKTRTQLQIDVASAVVRADSILVYKNDKIVGFISYLDFVAQLEATGISGGGGGGDPTNLSTIYNASDVEIVSSTGDNANINTATNSLPGLLSPGDKVKLDGLTNFDPSDYARKDIDEIFSAGITTVEGVHLGNQNNYGTLSWYGGAGGAVRATANYDEATKNLIFTNYESGGNYTFDGTVIVSNPTIGAHAVNQDYFIDNLAGQTNTTAFTPTADYHPATKKYVDDEVLGAGGYNDEAAQDAVGGILVDGSTINFTYNDGVPSITGEVIEGNLTITESQISDFGTYISTSGNNVMTGDNTFNEIIINDVTNTEIDNAASNALITKDWYNNNLYHSANNITNTPSGNLTSNNVQDALNELQTELDGVSIPKFNDHFSIASDYITDVSNQDMKGIITNGNITLDDVGISAEYQITFLNSKGADVTWSLGPNQSTKQYGVSAIPSIKNNQYGYAELIADNVWSIAIGTAESGGGGVTDHNLLTSIGTNTHNQIDTHISDGTVHFTEGSISITQSQISDLSHPAETDPVWLAEESNVPKLDVPNTFASSITTNGGFYGEFINLTGISGTINHLTDGIMFKAFNANTLALEDTYVRLYQDLIFNGDIDIGTDSNGVDFLYVDSDPLVGDGVGNRDFNDGRYLLEAPIDGTEYVRQDGLWVANSGGAGGSIGGSITDNRIAVGSATANNIEGTPDLTFDGDKMYVKGIIEIDGRTSDMAPPLLYYPQIVAANATLQIKSEDEISAIFESSGMYIPTDNAIRIQDDPTSSIEVGNKSYNEYRYSDNLLYTDDRHDADWTLNSGWSDGTNTKTGSGTSTNAYVSINTPAVDQTYIVTIVCSSITSGKLQVKSGNASFDAQAIDAVGTYRFVFNSTGIDEILMLDPVSSWTGTISSVRIEEGKLIDRLAESGAGVSDHTLLTNIGTNTHAQIDTHIGNISTNPHQVDKADVGLSLVPNTDFTAAVTLNTAKVTNATHTGDVTGSTTLTIANDAVQMDDIDADGTASSSTYLRGDGSWATIAGGGDVSKVGTPVNDQLAVWTGDGTLEGVSGMTYNGSVLDLGISDLELAGDILAYDHLRTDRTDFRFTVDDDNNGSAPSFEFDFQNDSQPSFIMTQDKLRINGSGTNSLLELNAEITTNDPRMTFLSAGSGGFSVGYDEDENELNLSYNQTIDTEGAKIGVDNVLHAKIRHFMKDVNVVSYTVSATDFGYVIVTTNTSAGTININNSLGAEKGETITIIQGGTGQVTIGGVANVRHTSTTLKTNAQYSTITLVYHQTIGWVAMGDYEDN